MKWIGIEISATIRYDLFNFRYESLRFLIRFIRPSLVTVFSSFVYIVGGIYFLARCDGDPFPFDGQAAPGGTAHQVCLVTAFTLGVVALLSEIWSDENESGIVTKL